MKITKIIFILFCIISLTLFSFSGILHHHSELDSHDECSYCILTLTSFANLSSTGFILDLKFPGTRLLSFIQESKFNIYLFIESSRAPPSTL